MTALRLGGAHRCLTSRQRPQKDRICGAAAGLLAQSLGRSSVATALERVSCNRELSRGGLVERSVHLRW